MDRRKEERTEEQKAQDWEWRRKVCGVLTGLLLFAAWAVALEWRGAFAWRQFAGKVATVFIFGSFIFVTGLVPWTTDLKEKGWLPRVAVVVGMVALHAWVMWKMIFSHAIVGG